MSSKPAKKQPKSTSKLAGDSVILPSKEFAAKARIGSMAQYKKMWKESIDDPSKFWTREASDLVWQKKFTKVLDWKVPFAKWFVDGKLNVCENCVDRHADNPQRANKAAIIFEGEPGDRRVITYAELKREVSRFANVLETNGVKAGDRVLVYMPMIPEATIAMLACARIGAVHSVVFGGFAVDAIVDRLEDSGSTVIITSDGGWRRGKIVPLKDNVDLALKKYDKVQKVIVAKRTGQPVAMTEGRDLWWHEATAKVKSTHKPKGFDSEHPLFILYTSGSTGKPKGVLHTSGGYLVGAHISTKYIFDVRDEDVYWCTADVGWITGHSYIVYGPLSNGVTGIMYEGAPNEPDFGRFWKMIEDHGVTIFYTAPTAIRAFIKAGDAFVEAHDLSTLRLLGSVGEPISPEVWLWYYNKIGGGRCPIVDTWWQTETGSILITPLPGCTPLTPGTATLPFFGVDAAIVDETGKECQPDESGRLVIRKPWPSMIRTIYGDKNRYKTNYWGDFKTMYAAGDGARRDKDGNFWITGRIDDVLNVSGHRLGTAEIESALVSHPAVAEAAVIGRLDDMKGQAVVAFVTLKDGFEPSDALGKELRGHVSKLIGPIARPDDINFAPALPKTRSGKIMRRLLKELVATGTVSGNITTLEDHNVIDHLQKSLQKG